MKKPDEVDALDESTWPKEKKFTKEKLLEYIRAVFVIAAMIAAIYFGLFQHHISDTQESTQVNLFPSNGSKTIHLDNEDLTIPTEGAKNYRVDADIEVKEEWNGLFGSKQTSTWINTVHWPNGGKSHFNNEDECLIEKPDESTWCTDNDGREYKIELIS